MSAEQPETPKTEPAIDPKRGLVIKLCEVMAAVGYTQKTGWNEAQKYHYVTEADIAEKIRPELAKRNLFIFPSMVSCERKQLERTNFKGEVRSSYATDLVMRWTIVDGDTGQERVCDIPGCSESPGDKGVYVAMTGSEKYLLVKGFLLPTGDDPENDANEPKGSREAAQEVGKAKIAKLKEKVAQTASNGHDVLFVVQSGEDKYEVSGISELMNKHKELLLKHGKREDKHVAMTSEALEAFKLVYVEEKGNILKVLKPNV